MATLTRPSASPAGVQAVLNELVDQGLVLREPAGRAYLYRLNRQHLAAGPVLALAASTSVLCDKIEAEVAAWALPPTGVWLFGSVARGRSGMASDVDLLVVRPDHVLADDESWLEQLDALSGRVHAWTGNPCEVLDLSLADLGDLERRDERLVQELRRDAVALVGPAPLTLLNRAN